jgi:hypothetical protein
LPEGPQRKEAWNHYFQAYLDDSLARQFYGLKPAGLEPNGTEGLTSIGAHPLWSVISGALLCLSDGAILDLPPFSNLRMNVMWIDDHLKYSLHRAMDHFTGLETLNLEPGLSDARLEVTVTKARPEISNPPVSTFESYLPTLLWGTIMDAWITINPVSKCRFGALGPREQARWHGARKKQNDSPLPHAMLSALRIGHFDPDSERSLQDELTRTAFQRIEMVRQLWARLKTDTQETFASYWAKGEVEQAFGRDLFAGCKDTLWQGIAPGRSLDRPISGFGDLPVDMALMVRNLIDDAVAYVHWTLEWPRFVQIVRSIRQGEFMGDLSWNQRSRPARGSRGQAHTARIHARS